MTVPDNVHMRRTMVIGVDDNSQPARPQNGWHKKTIALTQTFGLIKERGIISLGALDKVEGIVKAQNCCAVREQCEHRQSG